MTTTIKEADITLEDLNRIAINCTAIEMPVATARAMVDGTIDEDDTAEIDCAMDNEQAKIFIGETKVGYLIIRIVP